MKNLLQYIFEVLLWWYGLVTTLLYENEWFMVISGVYFLMFILFHCCWRWPSHPDTSSVLLVNAFGIFVYFY